MLLAGEIYPTSYSPKKKRVNCDDDSLGVIYQINGDIMHNNFIDGKYKYLPNIVGANKGSFQLAIA